jgi:hypothetical protein
MAKLTICFGIVLILLGLFGFVITGHHAPTALIPAFVGLILVILGFLANTEDAKKRMLNMHIADYIEMTFQGRQFPRPVAVQEKAGMAVLLLFFVLLCVRSFINARRARA